ncbi:MAG: class I SAM-dependent methyltransferase, partial [Rhodocyclaceae bacterium]|nr:class I SAM-dependent methyltransferase [Rhodocyclaceae bacterium]
MAGRRTSIAGISRRKGWPRSWHFTDGLCCARNSPASATATACCRDWGRSSAWATSSTWPPYGRCRGADAMNIGKFRQAFDRKFPARKRGTLTPWHRHWFWRKFFDPCSDVPGMVSVKKQRLLHLAFSFLDADECYLEVGTYQGKSLISAVKGNPRRQVYAVDNFTEFTASNTEQLLRANLARHGLADRVTFHNADFRAVVNRDVVKQPVGLFFYDG